MRRKIFSIITALALCLGLLPGTALAAGLPSGYFYLTIGGTEVTASSDLNNLLGDGTVSVSYEEANGLPKWTIHLTNANLTGSIYLNSGILDIVVSGTNSITTQPIQGKGSQEGISAGNGMISITGDGTLTIDTEATTNSSYPSSAISVASSGLLTGDVSISGISGLILKGSAKAIGTSGDVSIINSTVTASNKYSLGSNPVIGGKSVQISGSEVNITSAETCYGISSSPGNIVISDSTVNINSSNLAIYAGNQIQISNSKVTAESSTASGLYSQNEADGGFSITNNSDIGVTAGANWPGIYTPGQLTVSGSKLTAHSPEGNALCIGYGISMTDSTVTATANDGYPAVYTDEAIRISDSTVDASGAYAPGIFSQGKTTIDGDSSNVNAIGGAPGLIANGGFAMSGGRFHAKGGPGYPAVEIFVTDEEEYKDTYTLDTSRIELAQGYAEISGGKPAVSEWYEVEDSYWRFVTSFVAPDVAQLEANAANGLNEVTILPIGNAHTVIFNTQGGTPVESQAVAPNGTVAQPADPTRDGYAFGGWYTDEGCTTVYDFNAPVTGNLTLYAKWTQDSGNEDIGHIPTIPVIPDTPSAPRTPPSTPHPPDQPRTTHTTPPGRTTTPQTTAPPPPAIRDGEAAAAVDAAMGSEIVRQAVSNSSESVVIAPEVPGDVTRTEVSIPASTVGQIGSQTSASLTVSTPVADVTIPNGGLASLAGAGGVVTVTAGQTGNTVELSVTADGKPVAHVPGGVTLTVPMEDPTPGTVAVLIHEDGTQETIRKSVAKGDSVTIPLEGSAKVVLLDNGKRFDDVPAASWAADAIAFVSARDLFSGAAPGRFSPDVPMTRAMLAVALHNLENNPAQPFTGAFTDVEDSHWYAEGVSWAAANGIVSGYGDGRFGPDDSITREQLAVILWRYAGSPVPAEKSLPFADAGKVSAWAEEALRWAVERGILKGSGGGILDPTGPATRAETAQMLMNFLGK